MKTIVKCFVATGLVAGSLLLTGCGATAPVAPAKAPASPYAQAPAEVQNKLAGAPKWVLAPDAEGGIAAVGTYRPTAAGLSHQRTMAQADGRDQLAQILNTKVNNMVKSFTQTTGVGTAETVDTVGAVVSKQVASESLSGAKQKDTWMGPDGTLFVYMVLDTSVVKAVATKALTTSLKNDNALWQQFQAKNAQDELSAEVEKMVK